MALEMPTQEDVAAQLAAHMNTIAGRLDKLLGDQDPDLPEAIGQRAGELADRLLAGSGVVAELLRTEMYVNYPGGLLAFWGSPAGRAAARVIGFGEPHVPNGIAAVILGVSRQRIGQLREAGSLTATSSHTVDNESLRARLLRETA